MLLFASLCLCLAILGTVEHTPRYAAHVPYRVPSVPSVPFTPVYTEAQRARCRASLPSLVVVPAVHAASSVCAVPEPVAALRAGTLTPAGWYRRSDGVDVRILTVYQRDGEAWARYQTERGLIAAAPVGLIAGPPVIRRAG
jgi:hypothetical protein